MAIDGLTSSQRKFMLVQQARSDMETGSQRSTQARDAMEGIQQMLGTIFGILGQLLKGIFSKGGMKGGGGKGI